VVESDPEARYFGGRVEERSLLSLDEARWAASLSTNSSSAHGQQPDEPAILILQLRNEHASSRFFVA
jgi:hypothetical protein